MHIDSAFKNDGPISYGSLHQLPARESAPRLRHQALQQPKFGWCEIEFLLVEECLVTHLVNPDGTMDQRVISPGAGFRLFLAPFQSLDPFQKHLHTERFGHIIIRTQ